MEITSTEPLFRGRGRWMGDLALVAAAGVAERRRAWGGLLLVVALAVSAVAGVRAPALQVTAALVLVPLLRRRRSGARSGDRGAVGTAALGLSLLAVLAYALQAPGLLSPRGPAVGVLALLGCLLIARAVRGCTSRVARCVAVVLMLGAAGAVGAALGWIESLHLGDAIGAFPAEVGALFLLGLLGRRGPWMLWLLLLSVGLKIAHVRDPGHEEVLFWLAGPLGVVFAARVGAALRGGVTVSDGDAAAARLARAIQHRPWRTTLLTTAAAFAASFSMWAAVIEVVEEILRPRPVHEPAWFALPGPYTITVAVLFHGLARAESLTDRVAAVVGPLVAVSTGLLALVIAMGLAQGRDPFAEVHMVLAYTGFGPMLPALTGLAMARVARRRAPAWPAVLPLACVLAAVTLALTSLPIESWVEDALGGEEARAQVTPLMAIPWLLTFHRLVWAETPLRTLVAGALVLAVGTGLAFLLIVDADSVGVVVSGGRADPLTLAAALTVLLVVVLGMGALGVALARKLRGITALPEEHAVLHWEQATRHDAGGRTA